VAHGKSRIPQEREAESSGRFYSLAAKSKSGSVFTLLLQDSIEKLAHELLLSSGQTADEFDLALQFGNRSSLTRIGFDLEQFSDGDAKCFCQRLKQGSRNPAAADLVGSNHGLAETESVAECCLCQPALFAQRRDALAEFLGKVRLRVRCYRFHVNDRIA